MRVGLKTLVPLAFCAAAAAAALAHSLIDVIGDYALKHDSYDHVRHGSRELVVFAALLVAALLAARGLRACYEIAARNRTRIALPHSHRRETAAFVFIAIAAGTLLVPAMEWLDGSLAGVPVNGFDDAFGGSLLLGLATTLLCAFAFAMSIYHFARWLISHRDSIATIIETLLRTVEDHARPCEFDLARQLVTPRRRRPLTALQLSKRGPPEILAT